MKSSRNLFPLIMNGTALITAAATMIITILLHACPQPWMLSAAITCGTFCYHFSMRLLVGLIVPKLSCNVDPFGKLFQQKAFEEPLYRFLKVKKWKRYIPTYAPESFSTNQPLIQVAQNMCISELVHAAIVTLSFLPIILSVPFGQLSVFLITSLIAAFIDCIFILLQRYNRPRVIRLLAKRSSSHE